MHAFKTFVKIILRLLFVWGIDTLSLFLTAALVAGISISSTGETSALGVAAAAALVLGIVNLLVRPIILMLSIPLGFVLVFIAGFFANAITLMLTGTIIPGFTVEGFGAAVLGGLILGVINTIFTTLITVDNEDSFYQGVVEKLAGRSHYEGEDFTKPGLLMIEIDGLSYRHLKHAIEKGLLPTFKRLMDAQGYQLSHVDCGLPSQTSACQAGIMFGDNYDIPAFRWYDKEKQKLYVSGRDAPEINARYAHGHGLMRGGASINNMMNGDARHSLLTLADLKASDKHERVERARDISLLMLNPYFLTRVIVLFLWEAFVEVWEYTKDVIQNTQPRLNRLHGGYPFIRAATTVFMRDVSGHLTGLEIIRGAPSIYVTWPGYDEVAHHSGPWSPYAFNVLSRYDRVINALIDLIDRKAPRPYNLVILSDHGQSSGATFKQRYGMDLKTYIESLLPRHVTVHAPQGGDEGSLSLTAAVAELDNVQEYGAGGRISKKVIAKAKNLIENKIKPGNDPIPRDVNVTVCGSGNIAQVYFHLASHKLTLEELEQVYPGMVEEIVQHEGIGVVVGYNGKGEPLAMGKHGKRNLHTGEITGEDPMAMFGDPDLRASQMRRIADFPHAGDLIVNSTFYSDGTVAAMEELIGNHGGIGGEQTDAFIFHPPNLEVPPTTNSKDVYDILNTYREAAPEPIPIVPKNQGENPIQPWTFAAFARGFSRKSGWIGKALRAMVLDTGAYRDVAGDPYMTGPALFLLITGVIINSLTVHGLHDWGALIGEFFSAMLVVFSVWLTGRALRGKADFARTMRTVGFAYTTRFYSLLGFLPVIGNVAKLITLIATMMAVWIAGVQAHKLRGWRSILFPIMVFIIMLLSVILIQVLWEGATFTLTMLIER